MARATELSPHETTWSTRADVAPPPQWLSALRRYLVVIALGNLSWEFAHMPLYTIWQTGTWSEIIFAAVHCTGGDILIALSSLMIALLILGSHAWPAQRFSAVASLTIVLGIAYTTFSEWLNIVVRAAWSYAELMPVLTILGFDVGLSPLLQWIVVPLVAFRRARQSASLGAAASSTT